MTDAGPARIAQELRRKALDLLARREHARAELAFKLEKRDFERSSVAELLDALADEGLQSDQRFAEQYVRARAERGFGPLRIMRELRERGIEDALVEAALDPGETTWQQRAVDAQRRRFGGEPPAERSQQARCARFLEYRGFTSAQIRRALAGDDWE